MIRVNGDFMRFLSVFLVIFLFSFIFVPVVFADEIDDATDVLDDTVLPFIPIDDPVDFVGDGMSDYYLADVNVFSLAPITGSSTSGLKSIMLDLIGPYDPIIIEYKYRNPNATYDQYLREVQPDYVWLCSFAIFSLVLYCVSRLGGVLFGRR